MPHLHATHVLLCSSHKVSHQGDTPAGEVPAHYSTVVSHHWFPGHYITTHKHD